VITLKDKTVVFMGTPEFAVPVLESLINNTNVILVVSQPDKQVGRHQELKLTPIKEVALKNNIEVFQPLKIKDDYKRIIEVNPDIIVTCAYGQIIPEEVLYFPKYKAINVHASLLPKLRGGAPLHKALIYGYKETGVTIMYMEKKMDAGDIIAQEKIEIFDNDNVSTIHDKLSYIGSKLLIKTLPLIFNGKNNRIKQNEEEVTYGYNVTREEEHIDFNKTGREVFNQIRGLYPFPTGYFILDNLVIKVLGAQESKIPSPCEPGIITNIYKDGIGISTKDYEIKITSLKPEGKKEMSVENYLNGLKTNLLGKRLL
jgi:methionyl-tRNA formyltransferase